MISSYQNILNSKFYFQEDLLNRNESSFNYFINNLESFPFDEIQEIDVFQDGILSYGQKKNWGFYEILICKTIFKKDTISKIALIGEKNSNQNNLALYVTNYDNLLKLSGNSEVFGQLKVPNGHTEQAYINGQVGNSIKIIGVQSRSDDKLPKIDKNISITTSNYSPILLNHTKNESIINNGFDKETKIIDLTGITRLRDVALRGNIIITSNSTLEIDSSAKLNDILILAPKVIVTSGFKGNIQIVAKELVDIEQDVSLLYPSSIYIKNDIDSVHVAIKNNSKIIGGIVIDGDTYKGSLKRELVIDEKATVIGNVYCYGKTQLLGKIIGNIYTDRFFLKTESLDYENVILNGSINKDSLPKNFIGLPLFKHNLGTKKYAIIKKY